MKSLPSRFPLSATWILLALMAVLPSRCLSQTYQDVELEVAGPWDYVADPLHSDRIIVIAPTEMNHLVSIEPGGDATTVGKEFDPGFYTLDFDQPFDPNKCVLHTPLIGSKPFPLRVDNTTSNNATAVSDALGAKLKRFAISIPRPCYFESFRDARSLIDTKAINDVGLEKAYTTWMVFHYYLPVSTQSTLLNGTSDTNGTSYSNFPIALTKDGSAPRPGLAASIVLYFSGNVVEDYVCDGYSAAFFDTSEQFWSLTTRHYRLFPAIDPMTKAQTHNYNFDQAKCVQKPQPISTEMSNEPSAFSKSILQVRNDLHESNPTKALVSLKQVKSQAGHVWGRHIPTEVSDDLKAAKNTIKGLMKDPTGSSNIADKILVITEIVYKKAPGRADCHKAQFSINSAIN